MKAYIFIKLEPRANVEKIDHALSESKIKNIELIMGPYDAIVTVEAKDIEELGKLSMQVRMCPGIRDSITCQVFPKAP